MEKERVAIFIDGSNFYHNLKRAFGAPSVDLEKFCKHVSMNKKLEKTFYYTAPVSQKDFPESYKKQQRFLSTISKIENLSIFLGRLEKRPDGTMTEKGVDVKLTVDLLKNAFDDKFDVAFLVTNDADFIPAIVEVQKIGKKVINVTFPNTKSFHMNKICDSTLNINEIKSLSPKPPSSGDETKDNLKSPK